MKAKLALVASIATVGITTSVMADTITGTINQSFDSTTAPGGITGTLVLPGVLSINSITVELSHTWCDDIDLWVDAPGGGAVDFNLMNNVGGGTDLGLGLPGSALDNVAPYNFVASGGGTFGVGTVGDRNLPGTYTANAWTAGPILAGSYTIHFEDLVDGDGGAIAHWTINYTPVPAPGAIALFGLAGMVGVGRRRRNR